LPRAVAQVNASSDAIKANSYFSSPFAEVKSEALGAEKPISPPS